MTVLSPDALVTTTVLPLMLLTVPVTRAAAGAAWAAAEAVSGDAEMGDAVPSTATMPAQTRKREADVAAMPGRYGEFFKVVLP